ncbi:hypothetical protein MFRU_048g00240 [Monilinia fructicola]|uniref:Uncharacterized protein n=1 Tax=Monilinia fructicola TaxID=38448 RepID=A0A5M9JDU5_MONFR|nr:hypothetical protein EYC84_008000 [Monilinia fructicola]KAG4025912.1 hypothetical protein MFRU_048g00240 [Monilinia fructicola]
MKPHYLLSFLCGWLCVQGLLIQTFLARNYADLLKITVGSHWSGQELNTCTVASVTPVDSSSGNFLRSAAHLAGRQFSRSSTQISMEEMEQYHTIDAIPTVIVTTISVETLSTVILATSDSIIPSTSTVIATITISSINLDPNQDDNSHSDEKYQQIVSETFNTNNSAKPRSKGLETATEEDNATDDAGIEPDTSNSRDNGEDKATEGYNNAEDEDIPINSDDTPEIKGRYETTALDTPDNPNAAGSSTTKKIQTSCKLKEATSPSNENFYTGVPQPFEDPTLTTQGLTMHPQHSRSLPNLPTHLVLLQANNRIIDTYWRTDENVCHTAFDSSRIDIIADAVLVRPNHEIRLSFHSEVSDLDGTDSHTGVMAQLAVDPLTSLALMTVCASATEEYGDSESGEWGSGSESSDDEVGGYGRGYDGSDNGYGGSAGGSSGGSSGDGSDGSDDRSRDISRREPEKEEDEDEDDDDDDDDEELTDDESEVLAEEEENNDEENRPEDQDYGDSDSGSDSNGDDDDD